MAEYEVWFLHAATGAPLAVTSRFVSLNYTKVTNGVGAFSITLPVDMDDSLLHEDTRVVIFRTPRGGTKALDFAGFVRKLEHVGQAGVSHCVASGFDLNDLLRRRIVAYAAGSAQASKSGAADNVIKAFVRENLGALCTVTARDLTSFGFTVQADTTLGTSLEKAASRRNLLATLQEVADASHATEATCVYFGIVPTGVGWTCEFRTNIKQWGLDHRYPAGPAGVVLFGLEFGNVANARRAIDWSDEVTDAYAGGAGEEALRLIAESTDTARLGASPFNRCEAFADVRNEIVTNRVQDAADAALRNGRPRNTFAASLLDAASVYGRDWGHGDYVTASYLGELIDCRIETVVVRIDNGNETVTADLRSES